VPTSISFSLHVGHHLLRLGFGCRLPVPQHEAERRYLLHHAVVQLAGDPRALLLLRFHQVLVQCGDLGLVPFDDTQANPVGGPQHTTGR